MHAADYYYHLQKGASFKIIQQMLAIVHSNMITWTKYAAPDTF